MFRKLGLVFFLLVLACPIIGLAAEPIVVPAKVVSNVWTVEGQISGRRAIFMVDSGANRTALLSDPQFKNENEEVDIQLGSFKCHADAYVTSMYFLRWLASQVVDPKAADKPLVGVLGIDVLENLAVGFDYDKSEVAIWPKGKVGSAVAREWIAKSSVSGDFAQVDLKQRFGNRFGVPIEVDSAKGWCLLDTGTAHANLAPGFAKSIGVSIGEVDSQLAKGSEKSDSRLAERFRIGDLDMPWVYLLVGSGTEDIPGAPDGLVGLADFRSNRIVVDFPGLAAYGAPEATDSLTKAIREMLSVPLHLDGDLLKMGPSRPIDPPESRAYNDAPVLTLADRSGREIVDALRGRKADGVHFLAALATRMRSNYTIMILYRGKSYPLRITVDSSGAPELFSQLALGVFQNALLGRR